MNKRKYCVGVRDKGIFHVGYCKLSGVGREPASIIYRDHIIRDHMSLFPTNHE